MLLKFAISNFISIKERQVIDFRASSNTQKKELLDNLTDYPAKQFDGNAVRAAIVYGANAAGKSNFFKAFQVLRQMVVDSDKLKLDKAIPAYDPFLLDAQSKKMPSIFEIEFVANDQKRYFYELALDKYSVAKEELSFYPNNRKTSRKAMIFSRISGEATNFGELYRGKRDFALNKNQLLLSQAGLSALPVLAEPYRFFATSMLNAPGYSSRFDQDLLEIAEEYLASNSEYMEAVNSIIRAADTGINKIFVQNIEHQVNLPDDLPEEDRFKILERLKKRIKTSHPVYDSGFEIGEEVFDLSRESTGTIKLLGLAGFVVSAIADGSVIIMDELDKNLHPLLTRMIIGMFQNPDLNKRNAQLIFSTHDVSLIDKELFRLDQIFITDKNKEGISSIARLSDFKGITKVKSLLKWYTLGMFRGVPAINEYEINLPRP